MLYEQISNHAPEQPKLTAKEAKDEISRLLTGAATLPFKLEPFLKPIEDFGQTGLMADAQETEEFRELAGDRRIWRGVVQEMREADGTGNRDQARRMLNIAQILGMDEKGQDPRIAQYMNALSNKYPEESEIKITLDDLAKNKELPTEEANWLHLTGNPENPVTDSANVYIPQTVLDALTEDMRTRGSQLETGGVVVGHIVIDPQTNRPSTSITHYIPALKGIPTRTSFTFNFDTWKEVNNETERLQQQLNDPTLRILGWVHSHPGYGSFLSADDDFVNIFFQEPGQVAIVFDPRQNQLGVFSKGGSGKEYGNSYREHHGVYITKPLPVTETPTPAYTSPSPLSPGERSPKPENETPEQKAERLLKSVTTAELESFQEYSFVSVRSGKGFVSCMTSRPGDSDIGDKEYDIVAGIPTDAYRSWYIPLAVARLFGPDLITQSMGGIVAKNFGELYCAVDKKNGKVVIQGGGIIHHDNGGRKNPSAFKLVFDSENAANEYINWLVNDPTYAYGPVLKRALGSYDEQGNLKEEFKHTKIITTSTSADPFSVRGIRLKDLRHSPETTPQQD